MRTIAPVGYAPAKSDVRGRLTTNDVSADIKPTHMEEVTYWDADDQGDGKKIISATDYPLVNLATFMGEEPEIIDNYIWNEWEMLPSSMTVTCVAGATAAATTVTLQDGDANRIHEGQFLFNPLTLERMRVPWRRSDIDTTSGANQLTNVLRGIGDGAGTIIAAGTKLRVMSPARPEGEGDGTPSFAQPFTYTNYTQESSLSCGITERAKVLKHYSGRDFTNEQQEKSRDFRRQIQETWLWGVKSLANDAATGYQYTSTNGILSRIKTNHIDFTGEPLSWGMLNEGFEPVFRYRGPKNMKGVKHALCGPVVKSKLRQALLDSGQLQVNIVNMAGRKLDGIKFGWRLDELYLDWGCLVLHTMASWSDDEGLRDKMLVIDPTLLQPVYRRGGEIQLRTPILADGVTREKKTWYMDGGVRVKMEAAHAWCEGFGK